MKYLFFTLTIILTFLTIPFISKAQSGSEDAVYLKNGNIIYGTITENIQGKSVTIKTDDGNILTNNWNEIYKVTKIYPNQKRADTVFNKSGFKQSGFMNITEINSGFSIFSYSNNSMVYGINTINSYFINPEFSIGVGIGYESDNAYGISFLPIYAQT